MGDADVLEKYSKIWLADFFHGFPHFNLSLQSINSSFQPQDEHYLTAAPLWGLLPAAVATLAFWLIFLSYFIYRCCQTPPPAVKGSTSSCSCFFTGLFVLAAFALLGYGFFENEEANRGVESCRRSVTDINTTVTSAAQRMLVLDDIADTISVRLYNDLDAAIAQMDNSSVHDTAQALIDQIKADAGQVKTDVMGVHIITEAGKLGQALNASENLEYYRWMINILVYCLYIFIMLLMFIGLIIKSKVVLVVSTVLAVFCSVLMWATAGAYLSASVFVADLCHDPDTYFLSLSVDDQTNRDAIKAYITCEDQTQPYQSVIQDALSAMGQGLKDLNDTVKLAKPYNISELTTPVAEMKDQLSYATGNLSTLLTNVGSCVTLHDQYVDALDAVCLDTLTATGLLSLVSVLVALVSSILVFTLSCAWRHLAAQRRRPDYMNVDDSDPFLPRPPQYDSDYGATGHTPRHATHGPAMHGHATHGHTASPRPWPGSVTGHMTTEDTAMMMTHQHHPRDSSPPPAYQPGRYIRQYADSAPSPGSVRSNTEGH